MRNLNGRCLILVGEGRLEWAEAAAPVEVGRQYGSSRAASNNRPATSRKGAFFVPEIDQSVGGDPLRFLGVDEGELACSVFCPTCFAGAAGSLDRSRMTTLCIR